MSRRIQGIQHATTAPGPFLPPSPSPPSGSSPSSLSASHTSYTAGGTPVRSGSFLASQQQQTRPRVVVGSPLDLDRTPTKASASSSSSASTLLKHSASSPVLIAKHRKSVQQRQYPPPSRSAQPRPRPPPPIPRDVFSSDRRAPARMEPRDTNGVSSSPSPAAIRLARRQSTSASASTSRSETPTTSRFATHAAPRSSTPRRSDMHERDVSQIRSQSRAGFSRPQHDDSEGNSDPDSSRRAGTQRARTLARHTLPPRHTAAGDDGDSGETYTTEQQSRNNTINHRSSAPKRRGDLRITPSRSPILDSHRPSSGRAPLPAQFRPGSSSSSSRQYHGRDASEETILESDTGGLGGSRDTLRPAGSSSTLQWPSDDTDDSEHHPLQASRSRHSSMKNRRRRYASDAQASDIPSFDYAGRGGTNAARLSVDSSAAARYLAASSRARTSSGPNSTTGSAAVRDSPAQMTTDLPTDTLGSLRARKSSGASGSTGSHHRPSSRFSSRTGAGTPSRDVFDDSMREMPMDAVDRVQALRSRREALQNATSASALKQSYGAAIDDLRARIEDVDVRAGAGGSNPSVATSSRTSSSGIDGLPLSAPRLRSQLSHYGRLSQGGGPASEPRRGTIHYPEFEDRANVSASSGLRSGSRLAGARPDVATPSSRPTSRFSTFSRSQTPATNVGAASSMHRPMTQHERNTRVAFEIFERHFAGSNTRDSPTAARLAAGPESSELVDKTHRLLETVSWLSGGLREAAQYVIQREIDLEVAGGGSEVGVLKELDGMLAALMKQSDNQVRNLSDVLVAFTRADKERMRVRGVNGSGDVVMGSDSAPSVTYSSRPASRRQQQQQQQSSHTQYSPSRRSVGSGGAANDVRRSATLGHSSQHSWQQQQQAEGGQFDKYGNGPGVYPARQERDRSVTNSSGGTLRREMRDVGGVRGSPSVIGGHSGDRSSASQSPENGLSSYRSSHARSQSELSPPARSTSTMAVATSPSALAAERRLSRRAMAGGTLEEEAEGYPSTRGIVPRRMALLPSEPSSSSTIRARPSIMNMSTSSGNSSSNPFPSPRRPKISDPSVDTANAVAQLQGREDIEAALALGSRTITRRSTISNGAGVGETNGTATHEHEHEHEPEAEANEDSDGYSHLADASGLTLSSTASTTPQHTPKTATTALRFVSQSLGRPGRKSGVNVREAFAFSPGANAGAGAGSAGTTAPGTEASLDSVD